MNKKILMSGIEKDGTYKTPGGVPFRTKIRYRTDPLKPMVPYYRIDEFMREIYTYAELIGMVEDTSDRTKIRVYAIKGAEYKAVYSGNSGSDGDYYYVSDVIDSSGNLLCFGD